VALPDFISFKESKNASFKKNCAGNFSLPPNSLLPQTASNTRPAPAAFQREHAQALAVSAVLFASVLDGEVQGGSFGQETWFFHCWKKAIWVEGKKPGF